jgi:hypothetical protein
LATPWPWPPPLRRQAGFRASTRRRMPLAANPAPAWQPALHLRLLAEPNPQRPSQPWPAGPPGVCSTATSCPAASPSRALAESPPPLTMTRSRQPSPGTCHRLGGHLRPWRPPPCSLWQGSASQRACRSPQSPPARAPRSRSPATTQMGGTSCPRVAPQQTLRSNFKRDGCERTSLNVAYILNPDPTGRLSPAASVDQTARRTCSSARPPIRAHRPPGGAPRTPTSRASTWSFAQCPPAQSTAASLLSNRPSRQASWGSLAAPPSAGTLQSCPPRAATPAPPLARLTSPQTRCPRRRAR